MPFDLKNLNPPSRFFWPDNPKEEWVDLRLVSERDRLTLVKKVGIDRKAEFKLNPHSKRMERIEYADTDLAKGEKFLYELNDEEEFLILPEEVIAELFRLADVMACSNSSAPWRYKTRNRCCITRRTWDRQRGFC